MHAESEGKNLGNQSRAVAPKKKEILLIDAAGRKSQFSAPLCGHSYMLLQVVTRLIKGDADPCLSTVFSARPFT